MRKGYSLIKSIFYSVPIVSGRNMLLCLMLCSHVLIAQQWEHTYGGGGVQQGFKMLETYDGGFAILGVTDNSPNRRVLLIKTDMELGLLN